MKAFSRFVAVVALSGVAAFGPGASAAKAQSSQRGHHVHHAGCGHHHNGVYYGTTGYYRPANVTPYAGNPFPQSQVYGNVHGLGGTGYRPYGSVYSGYNSGAGYGYGLPDNDQPRHRP